MKFKTYKGVKVSVERAFMVGDRQFVDLRDPRNGQEYKSVSADELDKTVKVKAKSKEVVFEKNGHKQSFVEDTDEYKAFIKDNKLNPIFIANCLKGISKTHKGFAIHYR